VFMNQASGITDTVSLCGTRSNRDGGPARGGNGQVRFATPAEVTLVKCKRCILVSGRPRAQISKFSGPSGIRSKSPARRLTRFSKCKNPNRDETVFLSRSIARCFE